MSYETAEKLEDGASKASALFWVVMTVGCLSVIPICVGIIASESLLLLTFLDGHAIAVLIYGGAAAGVGSTVVLIQLGDYISKKESSAIKERKRMAKLLHPEPTEYASNYIIAQSRKRLAMQAVEIVQEVSSDAPQAEVQPKKRRGRKKSTASNELGG